MAVRTVTSDPKKSTRINGYYFIYYNKKLSSGGEALALIHPALRDIVKKGFIFDDNAVKFNPDYGASVLSLDFDESPVDDPSLPSDPEAGWGDPDHLAAVTSEEEAAHAPVIPNRGVRPQTARRRAAAQLDPDLASLPAPLMKTGMEIGRLFLMEYKLITPVVSEASRAMIAQKLAVSAAIAYYRSAGVNLSDEDVQTLATL